MPQTFSAMKLNPGLIIPIEFDNIALSADTELRRVDIHPADHQKIPPFFVKGGIVNPFVDDPAVSSQKILMPYLFDMDECPLPSAERKMLDT